MADRLLTIKNLSTHFFTHAGVVKAANGVFELMLQLARDQGTAFIVVTHDESLAARCSRVLHLTTGVLA